MGRDNAIQRSVWSQAVRWQGFVSNDCAAVPPDAQVRLRCFVPDSCADSEQQSGNERSRASEFRRDRVQLERLERTAIELLSGRHDRLLYIPCDKRVDQRIDSSNEPAHSCIVECDHEVAG